MTEKRKVSAKEILADIRAGVDDEGLMEKYQLSPQELQVVFGKMISGGVFTTDDLVRRATGGEKKAARSELSQQTKEPGWQCPICRKSQKEPFEKCPECGAVLV